MEASILAAPRAELQARLSEKLRFLPSAKINQRHGSTRRKDAVRRSNPFGLRVKERVAEGTEANSAVLFEGAEVGGLAEGGGDLRRVGEHVAGAQWPRDFCPDRSERERPVHGTMAWHVRMVRAVFGLFGVAANTARSEMHRRLLSVLS